MALIKGKDYFVIGNLGKAQREPIRQWMKDNNKTSPTVPQEGANANDCITLGDYKDWIKTQQWPNGYPNVNL
jgi:hypothetical protein